MATTRLRWRRYWALVSIAILLMLALALASQFRSIALQISEETTVITEPLKSDGKQVDYFAALEQETSAVSKLRMRVPLALPVLWRTWQIPFSHGQSPCHPNPNIST
jgi:hypothetical protein